VNDPLWSHSFGLLDDLRRVLSSSLLDIAGAFSGMLAPLVQHSALVIFTEDCTGRPQKKAGDRAIIDQVTIAELDTLRAAMTPGTATEWDQHATIGGLDRPVAVWVASTGALLVLTDPVVVHPEASAHWGGVDLATTASTVGRLWELVAASIRQQVAAASPAYLLDSRAASTERARVIADLTDAHSTTLESLLAVLRSRDAGDAAARQTAIGVAATAMVQLRAVSDRDRSLSQEPVARAFERLRDDLRPLVRFGDLDVQFVEPPVTGRALPGEVAHAGRAIVRGAVLALVEQPDVARVRVQWDCDGSNLLIHIRDDGPGTLTPEVPSVRQLAARVAALDGTLQINATPGWGSDMAVTLPLDVPAASLAPAPGWSLSVRERQVFELVASGARNRAIAEKLSISENTVKFHVANLLRKVGASTRAELAALAR
jgi:DNA-binding CsgD family transcriptional regulator